MTAADVPQRTQSETKSKILAAASDLFLESGIGALSVRAISKRAGQSTIGIYSHFQGKQGILDALYIEGFALVTEAVTRPAPGTDPHSAVMEAAEAYLDVATTREAHYRLIFGEGDANYTPSEDAIAASVTAFGHLTTCTERILPPSASGKQKRDVALQVWALLHGYVSLRHHALAILSNEADWKASTLKAVAQQVDAIMDAARQT